jgi:hypothetical protein
VGTEYTKGFIKPQVGSSNDQTPTTPAAPKSETNSDLSYEVGPLAGKSIDGLMQKGNIDVNHRPQVKNDDGSSSTIFSVTVPIGKDGHSVSWDDKSKIAGYALVPSIANGKFLTPNGKKPDENDKKASGALEDKATDYYDDTRQHLGIFKTAAQAEAYTDKSHAWGNDGTDRKIYMPSK